MPGGGGGADLDVVTAVAGDVLKGKVIVGPDGEPLTGTLELTGNAADSQVLAGKTYYNTDAKTRRTGTLINRGAVSPGGLNAGESYTIPEGYHNGAGKVPANSLASQTDATAVVGDILSGKTAWVKGSKITGNIKTQSAKNQALNCGGSVELPAGYYANASKITANSLASQTDANSAAGDILSGKTAWVKGSKITGNMATMAGGTYTPSTSQQTVSCSGKKMTSDIVIPAFSLPAASSIKKGVTITIYGKSVTGTFEGWVASPTDIYLRGNNAGGLSVKEKTAYMDCDFQTSALFFHSTNVSQHVYLVTSKSYNLSGYTRINFQWQEATLKGSIGSDGDCRITQAYVNGNFIQGSNSANNGVSTLATKEGSGYMDISSATDTGKIQINFTCNGSPSRSPAQFKLLRIWLS